MTESLRVGAHLLDIDTLDADTITGLLDSAKGMLPVLNQTVRKTTALRGKMVATLFFENSTRTRVSFEHAGKILGADVVNVSVSDASISKGESLIDTVRTLQNLRADIIVVRHRYAGTPYMLARRLSIPVINAGDGWHAHPTQALLDLLTILISKGRISGLKVAIIGDMLHSRVARSTILALLKMGSHVSVCGPPMLIPSCWRRRKTFNEGDIFTGVSVHDKADEAIEGADIVMALRMQHERHRKTEQYRIREYSASYGITHNRLRAANPDVRVMHPGPVNEGFEVSREVVRDDTISLIEHQIRNGLAVRMAVLYAFTRGR